MADKRGKKEQKIDMIKRFPFYKQLDQVDCGPTCLRMIAKHHGKNYTLENLREKCYINRTGVSLLGISDAAEAIGFRSLAVQIDLKTLIKEAPMPCIAYWRQRHFVVVHRVDKKHIYVADPAHGHIKYTHDEFLNGWVGHNNAEEAEGIALLLEPSPEFDLQDDDEALREGSFRYFFSYIKPYKKFMFQLFLGMIFGSLLQLVVPFLTQSIVDRGIEYQDIGFVYLILIAQLMLFFSQTTVEFIRSWILLHISTRINISLISDFLRKLMRLPLSFFDSRNLGDILQRIGDHSRIESFMTASSLSVIFSVINLLVFGFVLAVFNMKIFTIFLVSTFFYAGWVFIFLRKRKRLDFKRFDRLSDNNNNLVQLITGMQEIKLNNCEKQKRWDWERIQARLFKVNVESLALSQYQGIGARFINQIKDIFITFVAAKAVIDGDITLGTMLAIQYIVGQVNSPLNSLIGFVQSAQDAKISLDRLNEVRLKEDEEPEGEQKLHQFANNKNIYLKNVCFSYEGPSSPLVLDNITMVIPEGKVTAIVGASGSGKTTLLKLFLKFYKPTDGELTVGTYRLENYHTSWWRNQCGVVRQEGFIFSDTIAKNIALGEERIDYQRLLHATYVANIQEFIESLPLGFSTKIGAEGQDLSQGQKQRLLIARSVYKNPSYLFFDEATSALDANNEKLIVERLDRFFKGKTVVVVAHRLSTVKNADQIVVLDKGKIVEGGRHDELVSLKGYYYHLIKNQLELGT